MSTTVEVLPAVAAHPAVATAFLADVPGVPEGMRRVEEEVRRLGTSSLLPSMNQAARQVLTAGGKRLRSAMTLAAPLALGGVIDDRVITSAACIELIHAATLVHDDLMDNASERRGVRTVNAEWGTGAAVMVGDYLLAQASLTAVSSVSADVAQELAAAAVDVIEGQSLETVDVFNPDRTEANALVSIGQKTGALFRASCAAGARCAGAGEAELGRLAAFGSTFGLMFQILDDLLDLTSTPDLLGKPVGTDLRQGVYTVPLLRALKSPSLAPVREILDSRGRALTESDVDWIVRALRATRLVDDTVDYCRALARLASAQLSTLAPSAVVDSLRALPDRYVDFAASLISRG